MTPPNIPFPAIGSENNENIKEKCWKWNYNRSLTFWGCCSKDNESEKRAAPEGCRCLGGYFLSSGRHNRSKENSLPDDKKVESSTSLTYLVVTARKRSIKKCGKHAVTTYGSWTVPSSYRSIP